MTDAKNWKLGMSSISTGNIDRETFELYAKNCIDCIEISVSYDRFLNIDWDSLKNYSLETGVEIWSVHLPFMPFETVNIATLDDALRQRTLKLYFDAIDNIAKIGAKVAVVHPSGEPIADGHRKALMEVSKKSLSELANYAKKSGVIVAVEDLPRTCLGHNSAEIKELLSSNENLRICLDTNHLLDQSNIDFVRELGQKIVTVHISDYDFLNERHWLPFEGRVNWPELITALENADYKGPFMYEVSFASPRSILRPRKIDFCDCRRVFTACKNKQLLRGFGTPNEADCKARAYYTEPHIS